MHFDEENPPNMVVLGYKFNIFYPELIDKLRTPKYSLEESPGETNFMIIRFSAGPPYEVYIYIYYIYIICMHIINFNPKNII